MWHPQDEALPISRTATPEMPWGAGAVGGDRDVRGCASSWTEHGVMQEILSFPTKESCSKDHNLGEASTGDMSQAGDLLTTCFVSWAWASQARARDCPVAVQGPVCQGTTPAHQGTPPQTTGTNPQRQPWHQLTQPTPAWCALLAAVT